MKTQSIHKTNGLIALGGVLLGVFATTAVMSRNKPTVPASAPASEHKDEQGHQEAHGPIQLSKEAIQTAGIRVEPVRLMPLQESLAASGTVEVSAERGAKITPPSPGKIVRLLAHLGATVQAGQPLAVLDSYEVAQAHAALQQAEAGRQQAKATLQTAQAEIAQARAGVAQAEAEVRQAKTKQSSAEMALQRQKELAATGAFSQAPLQAAQSELNETQSELLKAQTELQSHSVALQRAERLFKEELISRSELEQAQLEHRQDEARVQQAQARVALTKQTLEREQKVFQGDLNTRQAMQTAEAEVRAAQGEVLKAQQGRLRAQEDVRKAQKSEQAAHTALQGAESALAAARANLYALEGTDHTEGEGGLVALRAPLSGVVTERHATLGEAVERTSVLFVVENLSAVLVHANVPEKEVARLRVGQRAEIAVTAYPKQVFPGVVQSIAQRVDEKTRTLAVRCLVENRDGRLKPEMFARVKLDIGKATQALLIPLSALDEQEGKPIVYVEAEGGYESREVKTGRKTETMAEILSGLKPGERIVVEGVFVLKSESKKDELKGHED